ncbi:hypothetical protein ACFV2N_20510 [Streptomyces sp. NPDC059680]|uniref:hypothetical protein n=1 Tax=Streptomyces TaxID=1883 RepID=UPI001E3B3DEC|nr:hypothetical protein [Streptomyces barringtoniae]MCC5479788.1 hypothetical protein [Streptomyces barringtoniae]
MREATAEPLPQTDLKAFRRACHTAARLAGARAGSGAAHGGVRVLDAGLCASFDAVDIAGTVVLAHRRLPVVAFSGAALEPGSPVREFTAPPPWAGPLADAGFRLLEPAEPDAPVERVDLSALTEAELKAVRYWRPQTLGELLFNCWD